ncbi:MAG TPA: hypothetical protein P5228_10765 [Bacteroidales bacterium]|nr:hypothetical protein [Bacteroidales bacterium]HRZ47837.1 hypothetical protein [Bacteroidales bacterium]
MDRIYIFIALSIPIIIVSRRALLKVKSHGFYRFFAWESIGWLLASNYSYWFFRPFSIPQIFSWILLIISVYLVIFGVILLKKAGKPEKSRSEDALFTFEQTTKLIDTGIYQYIRHPLLCIPAFFNMGNFLKANDH